MILTKQFGNEAEEFVKEYIKNQGFTILATNYRQKIGEIDIIAMKKEICIFVEVKARTSGLFLHEAISKSKQEKIKLTARYFLQQYHVTYKNCRFDVALLAGKNPEWNLTYIAHAFY